MMRFFLTVVASVLLLCLSSVQGASPVTDFLIDFESQSTELGLFFAGDQREENGDPEVDRFKALIPPNSGASQKSFANAAFIIRSADFQFRVKITLWSNPEDDAKEYPLVITIKNLMAESNVELKHAAKGYQWVEATRSVTHKTDYNHVFEIRDGNSSPVVSVRLLELQGDEL